MLLTGWHGVAMPAHGLPNNASHDHKSSSASSEARNTMQAAWTMGWDGPVHVMQARDVCSASARPT